MCMDRKQGSVDETLAEFRAKGLQSVAGCACHVGNVEQRRRFIENAVQVSCPSLGATCCVCMCACVCPCMCVCVRALDAQPRY